MIEGKFIGNKELTPTLYEHIFLIQGTGDFKAGHYMSIESTENKKYGPFSLLSIPENLPFMIFLSRHPLDLKKDQRVTLSEPKGTMIAENSIEKSYFCLAGGTGIVPFISLINQYPEKDFTLFWSIKDQSDSLIISKYLKEPKNYTLITHHYNETNLEEYLNMIALDLEHQYYLAGPYPFVDKVGAYLQKNSIKKLVADMKKF